MSVISLEAVSLSYGERPALDAVSLEVRPGEVTALAGPNGAGKSSLLRLAAGLIPPRSGAVRLKTEPMAALSPRARARAIAYLPPDGRSAWPITARRLAALGRAPFLKPLRALSAADEAAVDRALERAGATAFADQPVDQLSSGERARVMIARALAGEAEALLLDEPTAALDPRHQLAVMEIARAEAARGAAVLIAAHALDLIAAYADRAVLMQDGGVRADGPPEAVFTPALLEEVFGVTAPGGIAPSPLRPAG